MVGLCVKVRAAFRRQPHADSVLTSWILRPPKECQAQMVVNNSFVVFPPPHPHLLPVVCDADARRGDIRVRPGGENEPGAMVVRNRRDAPLWPRSSGGGRLRGRAGRCTAWTSRWP